MQPALQLLSIIKRHVSMAIISDCLSLDTAVVYLYQKLIIEYLKGKFSSVEKIYYVTDGDAQHFENRYFFINIVHHKHDFGILAGSHFQATAHRKGLGEGIGGNLKKLAAKASFQRSAKKSHLDCTGFIEMG